MRHTNTGHTQGAHATPKQYVQVAVILSIITALEVAVYYIPSMKAALVPILLVLSTVKFAMVVMFFMHLKSDHKLFSIFFTGPLVLTIVVILALMTLFGALFTS
ncbi:MAG: cytochrome C oxidase subunit IV [Dehalococcoidia bacterium]|nr:cytochrome C oxidase subunit IV [Dehalococcoidia bacterium]